MVGIFRHAGVIAFVTLLIAGCAGKDMVLEKPLSGYIQNPEEIVQATDWSKIQEVTITYGTQGSRTIMQPTKIRILAGMPYRFILDNQSLDPQAFAGREFFKSVAVRRVISEDGSVLELPTIISVGVTRGETRTLEFVAVNKGSYEFNNADVLSGMGGDGTVIVE